MRRLTFTYRGGTIQLVSDQRVEMKVPPGAAIPDVPGPQHVWYEVRDVRGKVLNRRMIHDPLPSDIEVFSDDPSRTVHRVASAPTEGAFSIVIPEVHDADTIALMRGPQHGPAAAIARAAATQPTELASFKLSRP